MKEKSKVVFEGSADWWEVVRRDGEVVVSDDWPADWGTQDAVAKIAGVDLDDPEAWVAEVLDVDRRHEVLQRGDYACSQGVGSPVYFVRLAPLPETRGERLHREALKLPMGSPERKRALEESSRVLGEEVEAVRDFAVAEGLLYKMDREWGESRADYEAARFSVRLDAERTARRRMAAAGIYPYDLPEEPEE